MGINGLRYYVTHNGYLKQYQLKPGPLIIDGNQIAMTLSRCKDVDLRFGGDYDVMYDQMYRFFDSLLELDVTPIVIFDGRYKEEKEATIMNRANSSFKKVQKYNQDYNPQPPLGFTYHFLKTEVFLDVLKDLNIFVCRGDFDADEEIMELASKLKCPVLSNDFDFCICENVTFLSWHEKLGKGEFLIFDRENFVSKHDISNSVLPLIPILVNDDHFQMNALDAVLGRQIPFNYRVQEALKWLKGKDYCSAKNSIISALAKKRRLDRDDIEMDIDFVVESYTNPKVTLDSTLRKNPAINQYLRNISLNKLEIDVIAKYNVPGKIVQMVRECKLPSLILGMLTHDEYLCRTNSIEDLNEISIHTPSKRLLQAIYGLLTENGKSSIRLKIRNGQVFEDENSEELHPPQFSNKKNLKILCEIFQIDESFLEFFDEGWFIFALAFIYWKRECASKILPSHVHSVLLTAFSLNMRKNKFNISTAQKTISHFLSCLNENETKLYCSIRIPELKINKIDETTLEKISHIHMYLTFQICLFYTIQIVKLLDLPHEIKISEFINGSFFQKFYTKLTTESDCFATWLNGFQSLQELYQLITNKLEVS